MTKKEHLQYVLERFNQDMDSLKILAHDAHSIGEAKDVISNIEMIKCQLENIIDKYEYLTSDWNNTSFKCNENDDNWSDEADYKLLSYIGTGFSSIYEYIDCDAPYSSVRSASYSMETLSHMITAKTRKNYPQIAWNKLDHMEIIVSGYDNHHYDKLREIIYEICQPIQSVYDSLDRLYGCKKIKKQKE